MYTRIKSIETANIKLAILLDNLAKDYIVKDNKYNQTLFRSKCFQTASNYFDEKLKQASN